MVKRTQHRSDSKEREAGPNLTFAAKDFPHHPKNNFWYIGIGILLSVAMVLLLRAGEYLLVGVVVALALAVFQLGRLEPKQRQARFNGRGFYWGDEFYPYHKLRAFWVAETPTGANVYIERLNFSPTVHIVIPINRLEELVAFLAQQLPWHAHRNEPLGDRLGRILRF